MLTACAGIIGLIEPKVFPGTQTDRTVALVLIGFALLAAAALYVPSWVIAKRAPNLQAFGDQIDAVHRALFGPNGNQDSLENLTIAITNLGRQITNLEARFAGNGDVRQDIRTIQDAVARIETLVRPVGDARIDILAVRNALTVLDGRFSEDTGDVGEKIKAATDGLAAIKQKLGI